MVYTHTTHENTFLYYERSGHFNDTYITIKLTLKEGNKAHPEHEQGVILKEALSYALVRENINKVAN